MRVCRPRGYAKKKQNQPSSSYHQIVLEINQNISACRFGQGVHTFSFPRVAFRRGPRPEGHGKAPRGKTITASSSCMPSLFGEKLRASAGRLSYAQPCGLLTFATHTRGEKERERERERERGGEKDGEGVRKRRRKRPIRHPSVPSVMELLHPLCGAAVLLRLSKHKHTHTAPASAVESMDGWFVGRQQLASGGGSPRGRTHSWSKGPCSRPSLISHPTLHYNTTHFGGLALDFRSTVQ